MGKLELLQGELRSKHVPASSWRGLWRLLPQSASGATTAHARSAVKMQLEAELMKAENSLKPKNTVCYHI